MRAHARDGVDTTPHMVVDDGEQWITLRIVCRRLMKCVSEDDICGDGGGRWGTVDHFEDCE